MVMVDITSQKKGTDTKQININMPKVLRVKLAALAEELDCSRTQLINAAVETYIHQYQLNHEQEE